MKNISRRNCLKLIGSLSGIILINSLTGCSKNEKDENQAAEIEYDENGVQNEYWEPTGNSQNFETGEHFIYTIIPITYKYNGQITIPEGYEFVNSDTITSHSGYGSTTYQIKYNFINTVPVTANEYKNTETDETAYPFAGAPLKLTNTKSKKIN